MINISSEVELSNSRLSARCMLRPRLDKIFEQAVRCKVVYVIASAGYGKTQAVHHYMEQNPDAVVRWMQLTESDNIAFHFWENIVHTISADNPVLEARLRELAFPDTLSCFKRFVEITKTIEYHSSKTFFVVDDFHLIHSKKVALFAERCAYMKVPGICMIFISRKEPEPNVVSLVSKGKASIIMEDELRFTIEEIEEFFRRFAIPLSREELFRLIDMTKGWALAINLFSFALQRFPKHFNYAANVMMQNIFRLFDMEAWGDFSKNIQKKIVKLSLLSDLPVTPVLEIANDAKFLKNISGLTSFIRFDSFSNDFRIHPLYLEFLQSKHHFLSDEEKQETYQWAAQWCSKNDFNMNALHYYAKSRQFERMVETLFLYPLKLPYDASEYLLNILQNLKPESEEKGDPNVLFLENCFISLLLVGIGKYEEAQKKSFDIIRKWEHVDTPFSILLLHATYSILAYIEMYICTSTHKYDAPKYLKKSVEYFKRSSIPPIGAAGSFLNADIRSFACLVGEGADLSEFDKFLDTAKKTALYIEETPYNIYIGYEELVACEYAFFRNQPHLARKHAYNAILKARGKKQYTIEALAENYLLLIAMQEGDVLLVKKISKQLCSHLDNSDFWNRQLYYDLYIGAFYSKIGFLKMVPRRFVMDERELMSEICIPARELFVIALYYIASKKYHQALAVLCHSYPREPQERFFFGEMRFTLLLGVAKIKTGDAEGAIKEFEKAYMMSFEGAFEMFFIELGKDLRSLVIAALKKADCTIPQEWLKTIDRKASIYAKKAAIVANSLKREMKVEEPVSLSNREHEVLLDLYHGLSREEIAANRHLSIHTVKTILRSVYMKLDACNNVEAVRIALEKKLIE